MGMPPASEQPYGAQQPMYMQPTPPAGTGQKTSGLAIGALISAIFLPPIGLVLSLLAMGKTGAGKDAGRGLAVAGLIISIILTLGGVAVTVGVIMAARAATDAASDIESQLAQITEGIEEYTDDDGSVSDIFQGPVSGEFGETLVYDDGLSVTVTEPEAYEPGSSVWIEDNQTAVKMEVTVKNDTDKELDTWLTASMVSGGESSYMLLDESIGAESYINDTTLEPGEEVTVVVAFGVIDPDDLELAVTAEFTHGTATFSS